MTDNTGRAWAGFRPGSVADEGGPKPEQQIEPGYHLGKWVNTGYKATKFGESLELTWGVRETSTNRVVDVTELATESNKWDCKLVQRIANVNGINPARGLDLSQLQPHGYAMLLIGRNTSGWPTIEDSYPLSPADRAKFRIPELAVPRTGPVDFASVRGTALANRMAESPQPQLVPDDAPRGPGPVNFDDVPF